MTKPNPELQDYGLREFTKEGKIILVSKEHSDELVVASIGASVVDTLAELGQDLNEPTETISKYSKLDRALLDKSQADAEALMSDHVLMKQLITNLKTLGYNLINSLTQEELQERYIDVLRSLVNGNEVIQDIEDYYAALRRSRIVFFAALKEPREFQ